MNSFEIMATTARKAAARLSPEADSERVALEASAEVYDYMAKLEKQDFYAMFDSGAFNDIMRGYLVAAYDDMEKASDPKVQRTQFLYALDEKLKEFSAVQAEAYYKKH